MHVSLTASDGHNLLGYFAEPKQPVRGGLVVIQEIFGVNHHIRNVTDKFAADGYASLAPALFDRVGADIQLGYEADDIAKGRELRGKIANSDALKDVQAAIDFNRHLLGIKTDHTLELRHQDRKRIHNLKYYTWIEQMGKSPQELDAQWHDYPGYWDRIHRTVEPIDRLIEAFNERVGLL